MVSGCILPVEIDTSTVLPLKPLNADPNRGNLGAPYIVVGGPHHCDGETTPDIAACPGVVFPSLGGEADGRVFQCCLCLGTHQAVH